jgi:ribonucleotide reductase beta subunit family protein with ferritin-like domain
MATTVPRPSATDAISYADLYARWERGNWRATEIDFSQDAVDWHEKLTEEQRRSALWLYALFFHGEDSVADNLSPYIDAAPTEEQKYFLTTQQVDEARHSVFFKRFMHEVVGARRRHRRRDARATPAAHVGPSPGLRAPRPDGRRAARDRSSPSSPPP